MRNLSIYPCGISRVLLRALQILWHGTFPLYFPSERKVCCEFLLPLKIHHLGRVRTHNLWVQWHTNHYTTKVTARLYSLGFLLMGTPEGTCVCSSCTNIRDLVVRLHTAVTPVDAGMLLHVQENTSPHFMRKSLRGGVGSGAVRGECVLVGGLKGCYWWKTLWRIRELHYYIQTENIKQLRVACSEFTFTVCCVWYGNVLHWITLKSSEHVKTYCLLFAQW
jgi:hypothetical protein